MDQKITPAYLLRSYAWALLKNNTEMDETDYDGLVPIVPVSEEPEISEFGKPHIVYGYALDGTGDLPARKSGSMTFVVYSTNFRELTTILNVLAEGFGRADDSARDINEYTETLAGFIGMRFGYVNIGFVEGGTPEETEGGRQSALINIRFEYYVDLDVKTNIAEWA